MEIKAFNKNITADKRIFISETIQQYYLISFILEERNIKDMTDLKDKIKLINRYEVELEDTNGNKKRYIFDEKNNTIQIKNN